MDKIVPIPIIKESKASEIKAIIGEDNLLIDDEDDKPLKTITSFVRKLTIPKEYVEKGQASRLDIAILRLNFPVNIEIYTPACLLKSSLRTILIEILICIKNLGKITSVSTNVSKYLTY